MASSQRFQDMGPPGVLPFRRCHTIQRQKKNPFLFEGIIIRANVVMVTFHRAKDQFMISKNIKIGKWRRTHSGHIVPVVRSEENTTELQSLIRHSYAAFCLK